MIPDTAWPFFEPRHRALAESLSPLAEDADALHDPTKAIPLLARRGLMDLVAPKTGTPDVRSLCLVREALGYVEPLADSMFAVAGLGIRPLSAVMARGEDAWMGPLLEEVRRGTRVPAFALTEADAGSDIGSMKTAAVRVLGPRGASEWRIDGEKTFISNAGVADHYIVFANADPSRGKKGISAFFVEASAEGLSVEKLPMSVDHPLGTLRFHGVRGRLVGEIGGGLRLALGTLSVFRTSVGAAACGMAKRALDETLGRVRARVQFGKPLASFQLVQAKLADMATELDAARLLVYRAAWGMDTGDARGGSASTHVAMAKLYATEAAQRIVDDAVQLHGGLGVLSGSVVERLYREVRPLRIYEGTSEIQRLVIGGALVGPMG